MDIEILTEKFPTISQYIEEKNIPLELIDKLRFLKSDDVEENKDYIHTLHYLNKNLKDVSVLFDFEPKEIKNILKIRDLTSKTPSLTSLFLSFYFNKKNISTLEYTYGRFREYRQLLKNNEIDINEFKTAEELEDKIQELALQNEKRKYVYSFISNKYKHLVNDETFDLFVELKELGLSHKATNDVVRKIKAYKTPKDLNESIKSFISNNKSASLEKVKEKVLKSKGIPVLIDHENEVMVVKTPTYASMNKLGSRSWCIAYSSGYFRDYVTGPANRSQLIVYQLKEDDRAQKMLGVTISHANINSLKITDAHDANDRNIRSSILRNFEKKYKYNFLDHLDIRHIMNLPVAFQNDTLVSRIQKLINFSKIKSQNKKVEEIYLEEIAKFRKFVLQDNFEGKKNTKLIANRALNSLLDSSENFLKLEKGKDEVFKIIVQLIKDNDLKIKFSNSEYSNNLFLFQAALYDREFFKNNYEDKIKPFIYHQDGQIRNMLFLENDKLISSFESLMFIKDCDIDWYNQISNTLKFKLLAKELNNKKCIEKDTLDVIKELLSTNNPDKFYTYLFDLMFVKNDFKHNFIYETFINKFVESDIKETRKILSSKKRFADAYKILMQKENINVQNFVEIIRDGDHELKTKVLENFIKDEASNSLNLNELKLPLNELLLEEPALRRKLINNFFESVGIDISEHTKKLTYVANNGVEIFGIKIDKDVFMKDIKVSASEVIALNKDMLDYISESKLLSAYKAIAKSKNKYIEHPLEPVVDAILNKKDITNKTISSLLSVIKEGLIRRNSYYHSNYSKDRKRSFPNELKSLTLKVVNKALEIAPTKHEGVLFLKSEMIFDKTFIEKIPELKTIALNNFNKKQYIEDMFRVKNDIFAESIKKDIEEGTLGL